MYVTYTSACVLCAAPQLILIALTYLHSHMCTSLYIHISIFMLLLITHFLGASFCFSGHTFIEAWSKYFCYFSMCAMCSRVARMWIKLSSFSSTPLQHMQHAYAWGLHTLIRVINDRSWNKHFIFETRNLLGYSNCSRELISIHDSSALFLKAIPFKNF